MDPVAALKRIAYLLEEAGTERSYKVQAFRRAAEVATTVGVERLRGLAEIGRLADLEGIGDTTARVIKEALEGSVPGYLERLEGERPDPPSGAVAELRAAIVGDCHSHSDWSDGGSTIRDMALAARDAGHSYLALTDHSPRLTVAHGLSAERLAHQIDVVEQLNEELSPFRVLTGMEVDILEDGSLDQEEELLARLDLVVASVHSKLAMDSKPMTARMVKAIESPHTDVLGHCTGRLLVGRGRRQSSFDAEKVFTACSSTGTAVEINSRPERRDPPEALLLVALEAGCLFAIDSDAHAPGQLEWLPNGCELAVSAGVGADRIVNTRTLPEILSWTSSHAGS